MAQSYPLKGLQPSMRALIRPMLIASLGLHALILLIPVPSQETPEPVEEEEKVTLTQLPPVDQPAASPSPRPSTPAVPPRRSTPPPPVRRSAPPPVQSSPRPAPNPGQASTNNSESAQTSNQAANNSTVDPFTADFPKIYPGSEAGSFGLPSAYDDFSRRTTDSLAQVDSWFQAQLPAKGFSSQIVEESSTGKVYQVTKDGVTQFLIIVSDPAGTSRTNYILSPQQLRLDDLADANIASPEEQSFYRDLSSILPIVDTETWQEVDPQYDLSEPTAFYADLGSVDDPPAKQPGLESAVVEIGSDPQAVLADLSQRFQIAEYIVGQPVNYGGGSLYEISRDEGNGVVIKRYLSLVPTSSGSGTAIFLWTESPV